jgi:hypothetical protein
MMSRSKQFLDSLGGLMGHVKVVLSKPNEPSILWYEDPNVVVDLGRQRVAKFLSSETTDVPDVMVIGNGGAQPINNISPNPPDRTNVGLGRDNDPVNIDGGRIGGATLLPGQDTSNANATQSVVILRTLNQVRYDATFNADNLVNTDFPQYSTTGGGLNLGIDALFVSELGLLTTAASDELFARVTFSPIVFQPGSSTGISVQWTISII